MADSSSSYPSSDHDAPTDSVWRVTRHRVAPCQGHGPVAGPVRHHHHELERGHRCRAGTRCDPAPHRGIPGSSGQCRRPGCGRSPSTGEPAGTRARRPAVNARRPVTSRGLVTAALALLLLVGCTSTPRRHTKPHALPERTPAPTATGWPPSALPGCATMLRALTPDVFTSATSESTAPTPDDSEHPSHSSPDCHASGTLPGGQTADTSFYLYKPQPGEGHGYTRSSWLRLLARQGFNLACDAGPHWFDDGPRAGYECLQHGADSVTEATVSLVGSRSMARSIVSISNRNRPAASRGHLALASARATAYSLLNL